MIRRLLLVLASLLLLGILSAFAALAVAIGTTYPRLPSLDVLTDYRPKIPLRVYTTDGIQIGEFGEERRAYVKVRDVPQMMKQAVLAAEDERFYEHGGIDYLGVLRAVIADVSSGHAQSGASTITMQVARNFFLTNEKTFSRKFNEALLAIKIERNLSKDQILELYLNQIYLGQRAYGFASAAQIYFGKSLGQLTPGEMAMLAGLPKAPYNFNPVINPKRARLRQQYVLRRMHELGFVDDVQFQAAMAQPLGVRRGTDNFSLHGEYVAEMVRQSMYEKYHDGAYTDGYKVYTTILSAHQQAAYEAVRGGVLDYDRRHGYRGPEAFVEPRTGEQRVEDWIEDALGDVQDADDLRVALVEAADSKHIAAYLKDGQLIAIEGKGLQFAAHALSDKLTPNQRIRPGALIRVRRQEDGWQIAQLPQVEAAFVSMDPKMGAIRSLIGGFDFSRSNFNHVTQAWRQPGSSFKPFIYSAGIERGFTPATIINDAPLIIDPALLGGQHWEPKNFDGKFEGLMSMRTALTKSKNLVSIRILQAITPEFAQHYITRFGFEAKDHPAYLTMALGAGSATPLQMAEGYTVFANTGYRVPSFLIDRIEDSRGRVLAKMKPEEAGVSAPRALDERNAFIMTSMMHDVTRFGTAARSNVLGRNDLAGKTGTTSDTHDAWFAGYQASLVAVTWLGYDQPRSLGGNETGAQAALPMWIAYMSKMLKDVPEYQYPVPDGVISQRIEGAHGGYSEYFLAEYPQTNPELVLDNSSSAPPQVIDDSVKNQLF
jgi:penicillin-binding protein 1A